MKNLSTSCIVVSALIFLLVACNTDNNDADGDYPVYDGDRDVDIISEMDGSSGTDGDTIELDFDHGISDGDLDSSEIQEFPELESELQDTEQSEQTDSEVIIDGDEEIVNVSCSSFSDCPGDDICNFSLGRCEKRRSLSTAEVEVYSFHPPEVATGDLLVVDGNGFLGTNPLFPSSYTVQIGSDSMGGIFSGIYADENRLLVPVKKNLTGKVSVTVGAYTSEPSNQAVAKALAGVISCDDSTPAASYQDGTELGQVGPYASGYLDFLDDDMRIFYPAECGSIRRKPIAGEFPLVIILHGNGAVHINYEYLAGLLATWGFISLMPLSESENDSPPEVSEYIYDRIEPFIHADLGEIDSILTGLSTKNEIAMIGHSRGCARMQNVYRLYPDLVNIAKASIWLGPAQDSGLSVPGYFMVIGAEYDQQSTVFLNFNPAWENSYPPKCKVFIKGGNHSLFGDHKIYRVMDGVPTITRKQQLSIVISYVIPFLQRAFSQNELWPEQLDNPTGSDIHDVYCQLQ